MEITFANGTVKTVYTPFDVDDNVRSIRYIAQQYQGDTDSDYTALPFDIKTVVDTYADNGTINLLNYEAYAQDLLNVTAWYQPNFDPSDAYNNTTNDELVQQMIDAGVKTVILDGEYHLDLNTYLNIEKTRQLIKYLWSKGLKTVAFGSNAGISCNIDFTVTDYPDFSDCEGFIGIGSDLVKNEPKFDGIVKSVLGRIVVAEDLDCATAIAKKFGYKFRIVTPDGQLVNAGGSLTGGSSVKSAGILSRKQEIEELLKKAAAAEKLLSDGEGEYNKLLKEQQKDALSKKHHEYYEKVNSII